MPNLPRPKVASSHVGGKTTYRDINEISKKRFLEELQRKWIKRERTTQSVKKTQPVKATPRKFWVRDDAFL